MGAVARRERADMMLRSWSWPQWIAAVVGALVVSAVLGIPTALIPNGLYSRMTPVPGWSYLVWAATSVLSGLLVATYVRRPGAARAKASSGVAANVGSMLAIGCPACNKVVVALIGMGGALNVWAPLQPVLAAVSMLLLGWALWRRLTPPKTCTVGEMAAGPRLESGVK